MTRYIKIIALLLVALMALSLSACGKKMSEEEMEEACVNARPSIVPAIQSGGLMQLKAFYVFASLRTSLANTTLTSMLDRMENSGLIIRKRDPTDRRSRLIALTDKAKSLQADYEKISQRMSELYYIGFTESEIMQFESYLLRVLTNLEKEQ